MSAAPRFVRGEPDARRAALIEACAAALAELGPNAASVRAVATRAGLSPGLVRHYFSGIDGLVAATYRVIAARIGAALDAAVARESDPDARLDAFIAAHFAPPVLDRDLLSTWLAFWSLVRRNPEIEAIHAEVYAGYRGMLEDLLREAGMDRALPARDCALALTAMLDGLWLEHCLDPKGFAPEAAVALVRRMVRLVGGADQTARQRSDMQESPASTLPISSTESGRTS